MDSVYLIIKVLFVFIIAINNIGAITVDLENTGLTTVPWNHVDENCTKLILNKNEIATVNIPTSMNIRKLFLSNNKLSDFPDLKNLRDTLTDLYLGFNQISAIDPPRLLYQLTLLEKLSIRSNPLVELPDLAPLSKLFYINLRFTKITTLPNLCLLDQTHQQLEIKAKDVNLTCAKTMMWTKLAMATNFVIDIDNMTCTVPQLLTGIDINLADLMISDSLYYRRLEDVDKFHCHFPHITSTTANVSKVACGIQCAQQPGCVLYAHDGGNCVLTQYIEGVPGTKQALELHTGWMMVK